MCVCNIYIYMYIYIPIYIHTYIHTYIHIYMKDGCCRVTGEVARRLLLYIRRCVTRSCVSVCVCVCLCVCVADVA